MTIDEAIEVLANVILCKTKKDGTPEDAAWDLGAAHAMVAMLGIMGGHGMTDSETAEALLVLARSHPFKRD